MCEVKMAGYLPSSFFCMFMDRDGDEVHKQGSKRTRPISSHLDLTSLVNKGFIIWRKNNIFLRETAGNPELASAHLVNHIAGFSSSCPPTELAIK